MSPRLQPPSCPVFARTCMRFNSPPPPSSPAGQPLLPPRSPSSASSPSSLLGQQQANERPCCSKSPPTRVGGVSRTPHLRLRLHGLPIDAGMYIVYITTYLWYGPGPEGPCALPGLAWAFSSALNSVAGRVERKRKVKTGREEKKDSKYSTAHTWCQHLQTCQFCRGQKNGFIRLGYQNEAVVANLT